MLWRPRFVQMRSNARHPCPMIQTIAHTTMAYVLSCAQRASRKQLTTLIRNSKTTSDELVKELGQNVKIIADLCEPIKALAAGAKPPFLQVVYFGAAALTNGMPA